MNTFRVAVIIPCHNEAETIEEAIKTLLTQSHAPSQIICIDDASTDTTHTLLQKLAKKIPILTIVKSNRKRFRAGALNDGLQRVDKRVTHILTMDADTKIAPDLIEKGLEYFAKYKKLGGVCSQAGLQKGKGLLYRLQKLEYGSGFDAERTGTFENVMVLHGMCTIFAKDALIAVNGFKEGHLIEDYDITVRMKKLGYKTMYNPNMHAFTIPPTNLLSLLKQRLRWSRGGVDVIMEHGINKHTAEDFMDHLLFVILLLLVNAMFIASLFAVVFWHRSPHPLAVVLGVVTYGINLYRLKFMKERDWKDIFIRIIMIPELALSMLYAFVQVYAYCLAITHAKRKW
jgi:poly-beta-1,6-N-acetyl-D-glucosamine synthase